MTYLANLAKVCYEANKAYCETIGDNSQKSWNQAEIWQCESAVKGVIFAIDNPNAPASAQHEAWLADKSKDGWIPGPVKDPVNKQHPCMVPYHQLPEEQRVKDQLFQAIVRALSASR